MMTAKSLNGLKTVSRQGFFSQIPVINIKLCDTKDNFIKINNCRQYSVHSNRFLRTYDSPFISKRSISTEKLALTQNGFFKYVSECSATNHLKDVVISVHDSTGLPWWGTVMLSTFILRTFITLPLAAYQNKIIAKIENITLLEMPQLAKEVQRETALKVRENNLPPKKASLYYKINLKKRFDALIIRDNCHPFKSSITVWFQIPTWIFFSGALRNMAYMLPERTIDAQIVFMKLSVGGFLWIPNLTQPDGLFILPVILGLSNLAVIEMQTMMRLKEPSRLQKYATNFFRGVSLLMIPLASTVPSIVCLYWTTSSLLGLGQNLLLMSKRVKKVCRIPDTPTTHDHPYQQFIFEIKSKFSRIINYNKSNN